MTKISFNLYYQQDVTRAIATLEAIKPTLDVEPPQLPGYSLIGQSQVTTLGVSDPNMVLMNTEKTTLYDGIDVTEAKKTEARTAEAELLAEAKSRGRGRPKKTPAPAEPATPVSEPPSLLMGSAAFPADLEAALAVNFDELLLEAEAEEDAKGEEEVTVVAEPDPIPEPEPAPKHALLVEEPKAATVAMTPDELKNAVIAKTKVTNLGMEWLKYLLKTYGASKLSDLTPTQMQEALDGIPAYIADREAADLLG